MTAAADPFDLGRFVAAQAGCYAYALAEVRRGRKETHWMWFVFPQFVGLGSSPTAKRYSIKSVEEARAFLAHPVLGPRLTECAEAVIGVDGRTAEAIFGPIDAMKLRSSATLFAAVSPVGSVFHRLLDMYFRGEPDGATLKLLGGDATSPASVPFPPRRIV